MNTQTRDMIVLTIFGAIAGLAFYALFELLAPKSGFDDVTLTAAVFAICFFGGGLMMTGPISFTRSLLPATTLGFVLTPLILWARFRFEDADAFVNSGHPFAVIFVIFVITIPFFIANHAKDMSVRHYPDLFDTAWAVFMRVVVSMVFTGVFWLLLFLSDRLLSLVGLTLIGDILDLDAVPPILTGAVFGLAIMVSYELSDMISAQLVLRLLRLLMPMITVVVGVFVIALPFQGLSNLFGYFSAGSVMMGMGIIATGLVSASIDRTSAEGVQRPWMKGFVQVLACLVPALGGLAIAAVWVRVQDYGWTPDRLAAGTIAVIVFAYGVAYAISILRRGDWGTRLRQSNILLAAGVVVVLALWLTPLLNPQAISSKSQLARLDTGTAAADLPLYELAHSWGHAGQAAIAELEGRFAQNGDNDALTLVSQARAAGSIYQFRRDRNDDDRAAKLVALDTKVPVYPEGSVKPSALLSVANGLQRRILNNCETDDDVSDCAIISVPASLGQEAHFVVFTGLDQDASLLWFLTRDSAAQNNGHHLTVRLSEAAKQDLANGDYTIAPPRWSTVRLGGDVVYGVPWE